MLRAHKIRLMPTAVQEVLLRKTAGTARYAYNWAKAEWEKQYQEFKEGKTTEKPTAYSMSRHWTRERPEWSRETARYAQTQAILAVGKAMINFWNKRAKFPAFKKKSDRAGFQCDNQQPISGKRVLIANVGWVRMREELRFSGRVYAVSVSSRAGQWHVSIQVELPDPPKSTSPSRVGVDVGIKALAVASDGTRCENPLRLHRKQKCLRRMQRRLARQTKGSNRRSQTKLRIAKTHLGIVNVRQDRTHKFTHCLAKNHGTAVLETLDIEEMKAQANKGLRRGLQDTAMREVHRQLEYKMRVERAPRYFPSSKRCSSCGHVKSTFPCSIRVYKCGHCGAVMDRDCNAALNLQQMPWVTGCMRGKSARAEMHRETVSLNAS